MLTFEGSMRNLLHRYFTPLLMLLSIGLINIRNEIPVDTFPSLSVLFIQALGAGFVITSISLINDRKIRNLRVGILIGNISYEFYLFHFVFLLALKPFFTNVGIYIVICLLLSLVLSSIIHISLSQCSSRIINILYNCVFFNRHLSK